MAVRDMATQFSVVNAGSDAVNNTDVASAIVDTQGANMGVTYVAVLTAFTSGTITFSFEEGDAANLSDATAVPADKFVKQAGSAQSYTAAVAEGENFIRIGLHSTKRYLRATVVGSAPGNGTVQGLWVLGREQLAADVTNPAAT